jgi:RNA polymerase sigma-70 factor, ECF subfamily
MAEALAVVDAVLGETPTSRPEVDARTLEACTAGNAGALRVFVVTYQPAVFAYLSRALGHGPHVEDLAQDVFLRAIRALPGFDRNGPARPSTWLLTIAANVAADARRRRRDLLALSDDQHEGQADSKTPETESRRNEIARAVMRAAAELPADLRDAFVLAEFHDLSLQEVADVCGVPLGTLKARLSRARERLRELLGDLWEGEP